MATSSIPSGHLPAQIKKFSGSSQPFAAEANWITSSKAGVHRAAARPSQDWLQCLKLRVARLVPAALVLLMPTGAMAQLGAARQACAADIKQLCAEVKPGEGRLKACVKEHFGQLSASCQTALIANVTVTKSCKADAEKKCPGIQPGGGRIQACMKDHFTELTEACKESLLLAKLQQQ
jgi:hypothetical protein